MMGQLSPFLIICIHPCREGVPIGWDEFTRAMMSNSIFQEKILQNHVEVFYLNNTVETCILVLN